MSDKHNLNNIDVYSSRMEIISCPSCKQLIAPTDGICYLCSAIMSELKELKH